MERHLLLLVKKYEKFIQRGVDESLDKIPFHNSAPIKRLSMLNKKLIPESNTHIAVHYVDSSKVVSKYSYPHKHDHDEINMILSEDSTLTYEIQLDDEMYEVSSPATVFIPKGLRHNAQAKSGKGLFVCIILSDNYTSD